MMFSGNEYDKIGHNEIMKIIQDETAMECLKVINNTELNIFTLATVYDAVCENLNTELDDWEMIIDLKHEAFSILLDLKEYVTSGWKKEKTMFNDVNIYENWDEIYRFFNSCKGELQNSINKK